MRAVDGCTQTWWRPGAVLLLMVPTDDADRARGLLAENRRSPESEAGVAAGSSRPVRWVAAGAVLLLLVVLGLSLLPDLV